MAGPPCGVDVHPDVMTPADFAIASRSSIAPVLVARSGDDGDRLHVMREIVPIAASRRDNLHPVVRVRGDRLRRRCRIRAVQWPCARSFALPSKIKANGRGASRRPSARTSMPLLMSRDGERGHRRHRAAADEQPHRSVGKPRSRETSS
jgi:hypothetical protein